MATTTNMNQVPAHRNTNALAVQQRTATVRDLLTKAKPALEQALPRHLDVDRLLRIAMTALTKNPKLLACDQRTLLLAVMASAQCGLEPNSYAQEAYLIPYGKEVQFMPSYRGLMKLARQSGQVASIEAHVVYKNEKFAVSYGLTPSLQHEVIIDDADRGDFRLVYAVARYKDATMSPVFEVMTKSEIDAIRKRSKAANNGPWVTDYLEMARKTVIRRICKFLPASVELDVAFRYNDRAASGKTQVDLADPEMLHSLDMEDVPMDVDVDEETGEITTGESEPSLSVDQMSAGDPSEHQGHEPQDRKNSKKGADGKQVDAGF